MVGVGVSIPDGDAFFLYRRNIMAWTGSICDQEIARRAAGSALIAENNLGLVSADLATVATAQAAADAAVLTEQIADRPIGNQCSRGFKVASNMGATFGSTWAAFDASLPTTTNKQRMITG